jgi:hypothetical protein
VFTFEVYISSEFNFLGKIKNPPPEGASEGATLNGLGFTLLKNTYRNHTEQRAQRGNRPEWRAYKIQF